MNEVQRTLILTVAYGNPDPLNYPIVLNAVVKTVVNTT